MTVREDRARLRSSRESLGHFFFELAKTSFAAIFIVGVVAWVMGQIDGTTCSILAIAGVFMTVAFAYLGFYFIKK